MRLKMGLSRLVIVLIYEMLMLYGVHCAFNEAWKDTGSATATVTPLAIMFLGLTCLIVMAYCYARFEDKLNLLKKAGTQKIVKLILELCVPVVLVTVGLVKRLNLHDFYTGTSDGTFAPLKLARMIRSDSLLDNTAVCEYLANYPYRFGYPLFLSHFSGITAGGDDIIFYSNVVMSVLTILILWIILRRQGNRMTVIVGLVMICTAHAESNRLTTSNGTYYYNFLVMLAIMTFVFSLKERSSGDYKRPFREALLIMATGIFLAMASTVSPYAFVIMIAMCIYMLTSRSHRQLDPKIDVPLGVRFAEKSIFRCILLAGVYMALLKMITSATAYKIDMDIKFTDALAGISHNILLNKEFRGHDMLTNGISAYESLWHMQDHTYGMAVALFLLVLGTAVYSDKVKHVFFYILIMVVGMMDEFLLMQSDDIALSYMWIMTVMSALSAGFMFDRLIDFFRLQMKTEVEDKKEKQFIDDYARQIKEKEEHIRQMEEEALKKQFDMGTAIKEGHIHIVATKAVEDEYVR
ncbi:MAG: glycosyltransferase family 39 protein [Lachnospiraceae bacterium]|nr:glycosyltransferase family 39 protein [Lachnospiraceae bacterium]